MRRKSGTDHFYTYRKLSHCSLPQDNNFIAGKTVPSQLLPYYVNRKRARYFAVPLNGSSGSLRQCMHQV